MRRFALAAIVALLASAVLAPSAAADSYTLHDRFLVNTYPMSGVAADVRAYKYSPGGNWFGVRLVDPYGYRADGHSTTFAWEIADGGPSYPLVNLLHIYYEDGQSGYVNDEYVRWWDDPIGTMYHNVKIRKEVHGTSDPWWEVYTDGEKIGTFWWPNTSGNYSHTFVEGITNAPNQTLGHVKAIQIRRPVNGVLAWDLQDTSYTDYVTGGYDYAGSPPFLITWVNKYYDWYASR